MVFGLKFSNQISETLNSVIYDIKFHGPAQWVVHDHDLVP